MRINWTPSKNALKCFLAEHTLTEQEVAKGDIMVNNYPYRIIFDNPAEGAGILDSLPTEVLVSFQLLNGGETVAIVRKLKRREY